MAIAVDVGTARFELGTDSIRRLEFVPVYQKLGLWVGVFVMVNISLLFLFGVIVFGGLIPTLLIGYLVVFPVQNRMANGRRANPRFLPRLLQEFPYSDVTDVELRGRSVTFKTTKAKMRFKLPESQRSMIVPFLQEKMGGRFVTK